MLQQYPVVSAPGGSGPSTPTPEAATFVVHPTAGVGDFTTIAAALAAIVAKGGGFILVREGTYPTATPNVLPPGLSIVIKGCGDATILDLGLLGSFAFTLDGPYTENTRIAFEGFKVIGQEVANSAVCRYNVPNSLAEVYFDRVNTVGVEQFVRVTDGSFDGATPGQDNVKLHMFRCRIRPCTTDASVLITNPSLNFDYIQAWMTEVQFMGDSIYAVPLARTDPLFGLIVDDNYFGDLFAVDCSFSVGTLNEMDFGVLQAVNCSFINNDTNTPLVQVGTFGSGDGLMGTALTKCSLHRIKITNNEPVAYEGTQFDACSLVLFSFGSSMTGCQFLSTVSPYPDDGSGNFFVIETFDDALIIQGCLFYAFDAVPDAIIEVFASMRFIGNDLEDVDPPVGGAIDVENGGCAFIGNKWPFVPTSGPPINDHQGDNYYYGNSRLFNGGNGAPIQPPTGDGFDPTLGCLGNMFEGISSETGTGFTGGVATNQTIADYQNPNGLAMVKGYFINTGANNITVEEIYDTIDQGSFSRSTLVTPGNQITLDPYDFTGLVGIDFQVIRYRVRVNGVTIGWKIYLPTPGRVASN
jgi:hypothetical protein